MQDDIKIVLRIVLLLCPVDFSADVNSGFYVDLNDMNQQRIFFKNLDLSGLCRVLNLEKWGVGTQITTFKNIT